MKAIFTNNFYFQYRMPEFAALVDRLPKNEVVDENFTWGDLCKIDRTSLHIDDYADLLTKPLELLSQELRVEFHARILHPWVNLYKKGSFQEVHYHDDCDIAAVVFLNDGPDFSKFYFWDASHTAFTKPWIKIITKMQLSNIYYPSVKAGDVILFPSHMFHGVTPHQSDTIRKTLSFNVVLNDVK
tara:strand:+ start:269 stop:823 length:555 start_codon:yes stop_codon:yes gene_type:complete